jgi:hypothetical protein
MEKGSCSWLKGRENAYGEDLVFELRGKIGIVQFLPLQWRFSKGGITWLF